jgi:hypothetical protein
MSSVRRASIVICGILLAAVLVGSAAAKGPFPIQPAGTIVLYVDRDSKGLPPTAGCPAGARSFRLRTAAGRTAGHGSICFQQLLSVPFAFYYTGILTLQLHGGRLEIGVGESLSIEDEDFTGPDFCGLDFFTGVDVLGQSFVCSGAIDRGTGTLRTATGWVEWTWATEETIPDRQVISEEPETITIDFS